jgi:hypothetical protein
MSATPLEIVIPVQTADANLAATIASLVGQTDRRFSVLLGDGLAPDESAALNEAARKLSAAGIAIRRVKPPTGFSAVEHWNWAHHEAKADWLKPLAPGEQLKPGYVAELLRRIEEKPQARFVRCDAEIRTDWGAEILCAPFSRAGITPGEVVAYFPKRIDWISRSVNVAYNRTAWQAAGGFSPQFPAFAALNLNVILALHHGIENIPQSLVVADYTDSFPLNAVGCGRVNPCLELWLLLRQARNYCLSAKIAWPGRCLLAQSFSALRRRV